MSGVTKFNKAWPVLAVAVTFGMALGFGAAAVAAEPAAAPAAAPAEEEKDFRKEAVKAALKTADVTYDNIATLMRVPGVFGAGASCVPCHNSTDGKKSPGGLDLTTCAGIVAGAAAPADGTAPHPILTAGKHKGGTIRRRMRDNRMPLGVDPAYPNNTAEHLAVKKWIEDGLKDDDHFKNNVLPLMSKKGAFGASADQSCVDCHMSHEEPPSFHELDLNTHKGILEGADFLAEPPGVKIVKAGKPMDSKLWLRLTENRMPMGVDMGEDRDPSALDIMFKWINQGAKCN